MYVPTHLEFLDRSDTRNGWPFFVTEEAARFAVDRLKEGFARYDGAMDLDLARRCIFEYGWANKDNVPVPDGLKGLALWDAIYAVAHRALLEVGAEQIWVLEQEDSDAIV